MLRIGSCPAPMLANVVKGQRPNQDFKRGLASCGTVGTLKRYLYLELGW